MAAVSTYVAVAAVVVAAGSAYESQQQAKSAASDRKKAAATSAAEQAAQQNQNRRQQVRDERVRRAQILQSSENTGASESSGEIGSTSALSTLISGNLAASQRQTNSANAITDLNQSAAGSDLKAAEWSALGSVAGTVFGVSANASLNQRAPTTVKPTAASSQSNLFGE